MKNLTFLFIFLFSTIIVVGQSDPVVVDQFKWDDPDTFKLNPPHITNYGEYSDSLSKIYDGYEFYVSNGGYYAISNLANYYYWFVNEYYWKFTNPQLYEYYFLSGNNYEMMKYIYYGDNYAGMYFPVDIAAKLDEERITQLERRKDIKYIEDQDALLKDMKADLESGKKIRVEPNSKLEFIPVEEHKTNSNQNTHRIERDNNPIETHVIKREEKTIEPVRYVEPPKNKTTKNDRK